MFFVSFFSLYQWENKWNCVCAIFDFMDSDMLLFDLPLVIGAHVLNRFIGYLVLM
jgi:hypothetical protein